MAQRTRDHDIAMNARQSSGRSRSGRCSECRTVGRASALLRFRSWPHRPDAGRGLGRRRPVPRARARPRARLARSLTHARFAQGLRETVTSVSTWLSKKVKSTTENSTLILLRMSGSFYMWASEGVHAALVPTLHLARTRCAWSFFFRDGLATLCGGCASE